MTDNAKTVVIRFGARDTKDGFLGLTGKPKVVETHSLWDYRYGLASGLGQYSGSVDPIFGPACRISSQNYGCYAATTGKGGPEGSTPYDHVTLKPGQDTYVYLDVGFWGGSGKRSFGLVCGPHVWLCNFGQGGGAPDPTDFYSQHLSNFQKSMGNFGVAQHATVSLHQNDWDGLSFRIYLILPDMHMWPNPEELKKRRKEFFSQEESKALDGGIKQRKLIRKLDGTLDVPARPDETPADHALSLVSTPEGRAAMKENELSDPLKMKREEEAHAFGSTAGSDLVRLLSALQRARDNKYDVMLIHVGDLLEMWAPYYTWVGPNPFTQKKGLLTLTDVANQRIHKWLELIYNYSHNQSALHELNCAACYQIYGNHDIYLAFNTWGLSNIDTMNRLQGSSGIYSDQFLWVEHGHRFQASNRDGYWMWSAISDPPGPLVTTAVNYYPELRKFGDKYDNPDKNLYTKNIPYATLWYLFAHYAQMGGVLPLSSRFLQPPKFRIFCQGHTHSPVLLKITVFWGQLTGSYPYPTWEQSTIQNEPSVSP